jgi:hypothetical protein
LIALFATGETEDWFLLLLLHKFMLYSIKLLCLR